MTDVPDGHYPSPVLDLLIRLGVSGEEQEFLNSVISPDIISTRDHKRRSGGTTLMQQFLKHINTIIYRLFICQGSLIGI